MAEQKMPCGCGCLGPMQKQVKPVEAAVSPVKVEKEDDKGLGKAKQ